MAVEAGTGAAEFGSLPFPEAEAFFRQKVNVPSAVWADILGGAHARAFTVAGATKEGMLTDFRGEIDKAITDGTTLQDFRKGFDGIVDKYGWAYKGGRNWRTKVIYQTNLNTAYAAGRYAQMTDPDLLRVRPYWQYCHVEGETCPRPEHLAWNGLVLRHDDPWWSTHYAPNGWGCRCYVKTLSAGDLKRMGKSGPDKAPPEEMRAASLNTSAGPITIQVPKGIDPGWGYSVGEANQGKRVAEQVMDAWRQDGGKWKSLTPDEAPPEKLLPIDKPKAAPGPPTASLAALTAAIARSIGATEAAIAAPTGDTVLVNAPALADHWGTHLERGAIAPFIKEAITDPAEIWMAFEQHPETGQVALRQRFLKAIDLKRPGLLLMAQASKGRLEAWTMFQTDPAYLAKQRRGRLIWKRPKIKGDL
jgi:hypothetical protein